MDADRRQHLSELYQERVDHAEDVEPGYGEAWKALSGLILKQGGALVVPPLEEDLSFLRFLARKSEAIEGAVTLVPGEPSHCHDNVIELWQHDELDAIGTGFALSEDELWRPHSWGLRGGVIIETTVPRVRYFGARLRGAAAEFFCEN